MILANKVAVMYGAGGSVGSAVARAFARAGARLFLSGQGLEKVEALAADITRLGGNAEAARVDALDEDAVERHVGAVADKAGRIDVSFNAIAPCRGVPKAPLLELSTAEFELPITTYTRSSLFTARSAARRMVSQRSGVILTITATPGCTPVPHVGGSALAYAALVALSRNLSVELGPLGVRCVCLMPNAIPETPLIRENFARYAKAAGVTPLEYLARFEAMTHTRRLTTLDELANAAVFAASDQASALTGTVLNLTAGVVVN